MTAILLFNAWGQGRTLLRLLIEDNETGDSSQGPCGPLTTLETTLFSIAVGLGIVAVEVFLLGLLRLWHEPILWLYLLVDLLLVLLLLRHEATNLARRAWAGLMTAGATTLFVVPAAATLVCALSPPLFYDALVYHLGLPTQYLLEHGWFPLKQNVFAAFPQVMEMNFALLLGLGSTSGPNLLVWSTGLMLTLAVYAAGRRLIDREAGLSAAALMSITPAFLLLATDSYVDVPLACFSLLGILAFLIDRGEPDHRHGLTWMAGLCAGFAFGVKYTGGVASILIFAGYLATRRSRKAFAFALVSSAAAAAWLLRNWFTLGNPIFPFLYNLFPSPWSVETATRYFGEMYEYGDVRTNLARFFVIPFELALQGNRFGGGFDLLGNYGWTLPLALLPFCFALGEARRRIRPLLWMILGYYIAWILTKPVSRFLLPALPLLVITGAAGFTAWRRSAPPWQVRWASLMIALLVLANLFTFAAVTSRFEKFASGAGLERDADFLARKIDYARAAVAAERLVPPSSRILVFGDQRAHYHRRPIISVPLFAEHPLKAAIENTASPYQAAHALKAEGVTHLLINESERRRTRHYGTCVFSSQSEPRWQRFLATQTVKLYEDEACVLLELRPLSETTSESGASTAPAAS